MGSNQIVQECLIAAQVNVERIQKSYSQLSEIQFNWKPDSGSWSIGECISHLINSNNLYLNKIEKILESVSFSNENDFPYKQSLVGKIIAKRIDPKNLRKTKTFKVFLPDTSSISKTIINDYKILSEKLIGIMKNLHHLDLTKLKISSPVNKLLRMNLGDALIIIQKHDQRHLDQADRVMNHKNFPKD